MTTPTKTYGVMRVVKEEFRGPMKARTWVKHGRNALTFANEDAAKAHANMLNARGDKKLTYEAELLFPWLYT